jgi:branched-chain amino acid transport system permease protein
VTYVISIVALASIFSLLTLALNLHFGLAGLVNFGIVAYFAIGAYVYAIVTQQAPGPLDQYAVGLGWPGWAGVVIAVVAAVLFAAVTGWPALRLRAEYLALTTFAFAEVLNSLLLNVRQIGNGTRGLSNVVPPFEKQLPASDYDLWFAVITLATLLLATLALTRLASSPFGATLRAIRDDELAAAAVGKPVGRFRLEAFLAGAALAGLAGIFYASFTTLVAPDLYTADITFTAFIALVIGGVGSNVGAIVGAFALFGLEQAIKVVPLSEGASQLASSLRLIPFGIALILMLRFRPQGLAGRWAQ